MLAAYLERLAATLAAPGSAEARSLAEALGTRIERLVLRPGAGRVRFAARRESASATQAVATAPARPAAPPAPPQAPSAAASAESTFDPYAFSVVALLMKQGREALRRRLAGIERPEHLRALAQAQSLLLDVPPAADFRDELKQLRRAILQGAERRVADRRAATG